MGIDEVGRGCWAGPLVAGAAVLGEDILGLKDSKLLSKAQRGRLAAEIEAKAAAYGLGWVTPREVDALGLTEAVRLAMTRAVQEAKVEATEIIIDGNYNYLAADSRARALIKADNLIPAVSAASILAKVARDYYMEQIAIEYPEYGFATHVGYGTKVHLAALRQFGVTPLHRMSYKPIKALL